MMMNRKLFLPLVFTILIIGITAAQNVEALPLIQTIPSSSATLNFPLDVVVDSTGNFYVADRASSNVVKFDSAGNELFRFGSFGNGNGQFSEGNISGLEIFNDDKIYIGTASNSNAISKIQIFDLNGKFISSFGCEHLVVGLFLQLMHE